MFDEVYTIDPKVNVIEVGTYIVDQISRYSAGNTIFSPINDWLFIIILLPLIVVKSKV